MARLPLVDVESADPELRAVFERARQAQGQVSSLYRTLANSPRMLDAWIGMAWPLRNDPDTRRSLRELVIMRVAQLTGARYEWAHHWALAVGSGVPEGQLHALRSWRQSDAFDESERAVLAYTDEVTEQVAASDGAFTELARHFEPGAIVELTLTAAFYCCVSRTLRSLAVDLEPGYETVLEAM